jgi:hypothetical protein
MMSDGVPPGFGEYASAHEDQEVERFVLAVVPLPVDVSVVLLSCVVAYVVPLGDVVYESECCINI